MIINIRGNNGSGKSFLARRFLQGPVVSPIFGVLGGKRPEAYVTTVKNKPLYVLGPYLPGVSTAGVDVLSKYLGMNGVVSLLDNYYSRGNILFESVIISTLFGSVGRWLAQHKSEVLVIFLDTPLEECIKSIKCRHGEMKTMSNLKRKSGGIGYINNLLRCEGLTVQDATRDSAYQLIWDVL